MRAPNRPRWRLLAWARRYGPTGAFSFSLAVHLTAVVLLMNVMWIHHVPEVEDLVLQLSIKKDEPEPPEEPEKKRDIVVSEEKTEEPKEIPVERPADEPDPKPEDPTQFLEENPLLIAQLDMLGNKGKEEAMGNQSVAAPGDTKVAKVDIFKGRSGEGKHVALLRGGGSDASENAVALGLEWLKQHQCRSGAWSTWRFIEQCPASNKCKGAGTDARNFEPAMTGLALLCYLGAGHTHKVGDFRPAIARGLRYLRNIQQQDGAFGQKHSHLMYNHSIATLALAEAYAMSHDEELRAPLREAIMFIAIARQANGGWDYTQSKTGRNDTSITGWVVMALKSASVGGIAVPWQTIFGSMQHFDRMTEKDGQVLYANRDVGEGRKGVGMVAVGMLCRQFLGWPKTDPTFDRMARLMLQEPPTWKALSSLSFNTMYYWYYATLSLFQHGGVPWRKWNGYLRDMLCRQQGQDGHANGSWDPEGRWFGPVGGRVYSTTMAILSLEVYYRYLPIYEEGGAIDSEAVLLKAYQKGSQKDRLHALKILAQMGSDMLASAYRTALSDEDVFIRMHAAEALLQLGDHAGIPVLTDLLHHQNGFIRSKAIGLLAKTDDPLIVPSLARALLDNQEFVAEKAAMLLIRITGRDHDFDTSAPSREKEAIVRKYQQWWEAHEAELRTAGPAKGKPKPIAGKVLAIRRDARMLMLDIGSRLGAKKGQQFYVFRSGEYIGAVKIDHIVEGDLSSATILKDFTVKTIEQDDEVRNLLD